MKPPSFSEALRFWLKLGFISFGGPAGQIAIMHEYLVEKKKWISDSKFLHALNFTMILPGPEAQQLATYMGWLLHGARGGLAAGALFVLPSMFILLGLSMVYVIFGNVPWVYALFDGLKPAVIAIVIFAGAPIIEKTQENRQVKEVFGLVTAAVVGVVLNLTIYLGRAVIFPKELSLAATDWVALGWVAVSFLAMYRYKVGMMAWIGLSALFGLVEYFIFH